MLVVSGLIDRLNRFFAIIAAVLVLASCLISAGNAVTRYAFNLSSNAFLEIQWQMFAAIFLLGAPYVLKLNEHVRVDIIFGGLSPRAKLWVDVFGIIFFLMPAAVVLAWLGLDFAQTSWLRNEVSSNAGGLYLWPVKALLPFAFFLLALQGVSELIKRIAALRGDHAFDLTYEKPLQ